MSNTWNPHALPRADGKTFVVTGGNAGIGYFITEQLASTGATVVIASRNPTKAANATQAVTARWPDARLEFIKLDLSSLKSVTVAATEISQLATVDGLVLNAGLLAQKLRSNTVDGHDMMFGTNHLGNFALVQQVLQAMERNPGSRIVTVGSVAHRFGRINLDDLDGSARTQRPFQAYATSKLEQMLTGLELDRRLNAKSSNTISLLAHPGGAVDGLTPSRAPVFVRTRPERLKGVARMAVAQGNDHAAWPSVRALLDPHTKGSELWGPRLAHTKGRPVRETLSGKLQDRALADALWVATTTLLETALIA